MAVVGLSPLAAAPVVPPAKTEPPRSVFVMPTSPKEGRNPFFPSSIHPYQEPQPGQHADISALKVGGIVRTENSFFAIINNVTFGVGDEADVKALGGKIHVHCLEIKADSVVVEAGGQTRTLILSNP